MAAAKRVKALTFDALTLLLLNPTDIKVFTISFVVSFRVTVDLIAFASGIDPPVPDVFLDRAIPLPTLGSASSNSAVLASSVPTGNTTSTATVPNIAASGLLTADWNTSSTGAFRLSSLGAAGATVRDGKGNTVGTGAVGLSAAGAVPASIAGNDRYNVSGGGSLSFYGPAESSSASAAIGPPTRRPSRATCRSR